MKNNYQSSPSESYLRLLEPEYVCLAIRYLIYPHKSSKLYYNRAMMDKEKKIKQIARQLDLDSFFTNGEWADEVMNNVIPNDSDYPRFIYNHHLKKKGSLSNKQVLFWGSLVRAVKGDSNYFGICERVDRKQGSVRLNVFKDDSDVTVEMSFPSEICERLPYEDSDRFFWDRSDYVEDILSLKDDIFILSAERTNEQVNGNKRDKDEDPEAYPEEI